jgi:hypothetical protein
VAVTIHNYCKKTYQPSQSPVAGSGLHAWIMREVRIASDVFYLTDSAILDLLLPLAVSAGRPEGEARSEIEKTISTVRRTRGTGSGERKPKWPNPDLELIESIVRKETAELAGANPLDVIQSRSTLPVTAEQAVKALFPGDPLICVGASRSSFFTGKVSDFKWFSTGQFIVPSPMRSVKGYTQAGKLSYKSATNIGARRYLVLEFDKGSKELQACIILHLWRKVEPVLVVDSGGKSLHAWFYVEGQSEEVIRATMEQAVLRGADPATFTPSQFVRMPGGLRDNGNRQEILFFKPTNKT